MSTTKLTFKNQNGIELSAKLELPESQPPHNYAVFAHCFTCNKNLNAVRSISRALNREGIAVLRFDFTGLGESKGDFSDSNFSSNVSDIKSACDFLALHYTPPSILVGHSLGGAAVIFAAEQIDSIKAVATIGAPASPQHITHLFENDLDTIITSGSAKINLGGRPFNISRQFIDDVSSKNMSSILTTLRKALIVFHSPQDNIVTIDNAAEIYKIAHHPKSFVSLDKADHLLSRKEDSEYVGMVIAGWVKRYITLPSPKQLLSNNQVVVSLGTDGFTTDIKAGKHALIADEPESVGGNGLGPSPYEYVAIGLASCTAMTIKMYANRKNWDLQQIVVHVDHHKDYADDCENVEQLAKKIDIFDRKLELLGDLSSDQTKKLLAIADKCPVHKILSATSKIKTSIKQ